MLPYSNSFHGGRSSSSTKVLALEETCNISIETSQQKPVLPARCVSVEKSWPSTGKILLLWSCNWMIRSAQFRSITSMHGSKLKLSLKLKWYFHQSSPTLWARRELGIHGKTCNSQNSCWTLEFFCKSWELGAHRMTYNFTELLFSASVEKWALIAWLTTELLLNTIAFLQELRIGCAHCMTYRTLVKHYGFLQELSSLSEG